jgi:hypothetical protein
MPLPKLTKPVLLVAFRRPDLTRQAFDVLRRVQPPALYIALDAPRPSRLGEAAACAEVKSVLRNIDWPCTVHRNYAEANLGSGGRVPSAISWVFEQEEECIILEDDILPSESFFYYCQELLDYYRDELRVMTISGQLGDPRHGETKYSYFFSKYTRTWGWATWRRAWKLYDHQLTKLSAFEASGALRKRCFNRREEAFLRRMLALITTNRLNAWDFRWLIACWIHNGVTATSGVNSVTNVGFRSDATHTFAASHGHLSFRASAVKFPLHHPPAIIEDRKRDYAYWHTVLMSPSSFRIRLRRRWLDLSRRVCGLLASAEKLQSGMRVPSIR